MKSQFGEERNMVLPIEKFSSLVLPRNAIMLQHLIIQFLLSNLSSGCLREVKNKRKFQTFSSKSGRLREVAYERWSLTRGSKYNDLS